LANIVAQIFGGFLSGLLAGLIGFASGAVTNAMFEAFKPFNPMIAVLGVAYAIFSFLYGVAEAWIAGFFFSLGIICTGILLNDSVTVLGGVISIAGIVISALRKRNGGDPF
jgi:hypothetical protein